MHFLCEINICDYLEKIISGQQLSQCPGQVYLWEDVLVDGHPYQHDAGHQASKTILHWCAGHCWFWDFWCRLFNKWQHFWKHFLHSETLVITIQFLKTSNSRFIKCPLLVQQHGAAVHQLYQWETATVLQPPHVRPGARGGQEGGYHLGVHWLRHGLGCLHWANWEGKQHCITKYHDCNTDSIPP